jgi:PKD repeat protein
MTIPTARDSSSMTPPVNDFIGNLTKILTGEQILFTGQSTGTPTSWAWTFEGGVPSTSTEKYLPPVVYNNPGKFVVPLVVANENGSNSMVRTEYLLVGGTGLGEVQNRTLLICPNPADHKGTIETNRKILIY